MLPPALLIAMINFSLDVYDRVAAQLKKDTGTAPTREEVMAALHANASKIVGTADAWLAANPKTGE